MNDSGEEPLIPSDRFLSTGREPPMDSKPVKSSWLVYAISSGACAAMNGAFAKLTTTALTTSIAEHVSTSLSLSPSNKVVEYAIRALFFALNLLFNFIMWTLFTRALTRATSTTRVSIINTSANFMLTALLGLVIFSESLPGLWWVGAAMLVAGNVVIGRREEKEVEQVGQESGGADEERERLREEEEEEEEEEETLVEESLEEQRRGGLQLK
ncbi:hypothetical protein MMC20_002124 [Loxospora ochrophaea]|nr:hypothetical protein [Loxospora ochrophaea]